jgi:hypothetical protein
MKQIFNYRSIIVWLITFFGLNAPLWSQGGNAPSANAAALGKYTEIPVSLHTGVPEILVPIFTVSEGNLSLPISLSYHSSGVRVDELASSVGLGWALNAGGVITRSVVGKKDEDNGYFTNHGPAPLTEDPFCVANPNFTTSYVSHYNTTCGCYGTMEIGHGFVPFQPTMTRHPSNFPCKQAFYDAFEGRQDVEPDLFSFNFNGYSGRFMFDKNGVAQTIPTQDLKIEPIGILPGDGTQTFKSWVVTTPDGTRYTFGDLGAMEKTVYSTSTSKEVAHSWYLTRIESPNLHHWIQLEYQAENYRFYNRTEHSASYTPVGNAWSELPPGYATNSVTGVVLKQITTTSGQTIVDFRLSGTNREDVITTNAKSLSFIEVNHGNFCKKFILGQDYFESTATNTEVSVNDITDKKRLRLLSVQEKSCDNTPRIARISIYL